MNAPTTEETVAALRKCWHPVARVEDLADGPKSAVLLGTRLAVFLTENGDPGVLTDQCPHRGASLSLGKVKGDALQCPYHGWEWARGDGRCVRIPSLPDQQQIPPRACATAYPARIQWGLVWTTLEDPVVDPPSVPWFDPDTWIWGLGTPFEVPVGIGVTIENFRDVAHFSFVHQNTFGAVPEIVEPLKPERNGLEVQLVREFQAGDGGDRVWGSIERMRYHVIAPNFTSVQMFTSGGDRCLLHVARPVSATECVNYWLEGFTPDFTEYTLEEVIAFEERVYAEDRPIVASIQPPELPLDGGQVSTLADAFTLQYRRAMIEFVERALELTQAEAEPSAAVGG